MPQNDRLLDNHSEDRELSPWERVLLVFGTV
jgi:hypothetical protein